jgi:hypothetical protein
MKHVELILRWRKCFQCNEETPIPARGEDDPYPRFCCYCGTPFTELFGHG